MEEDEEKMQKRMESSCSSSTSAMTGEMEYGSASGLFFSFFLQDSVKNLPNGFILCLGFGSYIL